MSDAVSMQHAVRARTVTFHGKEQELHALCRRFHIDVRTATSRLARGWTPEETFREPVRTYPKQVERHRAPWQPRPQEPVARTLPSQLLDDAEALLRECAAVLRDSPLASRRQALTMAACENWLRRRGGATAATPAAAR